MHADTECAEKKRAPLRVGWVYAESKSDVPPKRCGVREQPVRNSVCGRAGVRRGPFRVPLMRREADLRDGRLKVIASDGEGLSDGAFIVHGGNVECIPVARATA